MICKYCQKGNLHWVETRVGWRLFDIKNQQHNCLKEKILATPKRPKIELRNDPKINKALKIFKQQLKKSYHY